MKVGPVANQMTQGTFSLGPTTGAVMIVTFASAILGMFRESMVAAYLGANWEMDAYFFAFAFVTLLPAFMLTATRASLVPVYVHCTEERSRTVLASSVVNLYLLLLVATTALVITTAPIIASTLASGFDTSAQQLVSRLIRILAPTILLTGLWSLLTTLLDAEGRLVVSAISGVWPAVGVIGAVLLTQQYLGIYSLTAGLLVASLCQVLWTAFWLWRQGVKYRFVLDLSDPQLRQFLSLLWPCIVGSFLGYSITILDRFMASYLPEGAVSALSYASRPVSVLSRVSILSVTTVLLPALSLRSAGSDLESFKETLSQALGMLVFAMAPLSILLAAVRMPVIQLLFQRGKFDASAAASTANVFGGYALGLLPMAIAITLATAFNALEDTRSQSFFGAGSNFVSKLVFNPILILVLGVTGIALATSLMYVVSASVLLLILRRRLQGVGGEHLLETFLRVLIAVLLAAGPVTLLVNRCHMPPIVVIGIGALIGSVLYLVFAAILRIPELPLAYRYLLRLMTAWSLSIGRNRPGMRGDPSGLSAEMPSDLADDGR